MNDNSTAIAAAIAAASAAGGGVVIVPPGTWATGPIHLRFEATVNAGLPVAQRDGTQYHFRPAFIEPYGCERVLIEGVTVRNSPFWHLHPTLCRDVTVRGVTVNSSGPNTDGCDPECCDGVLIDGVSFNCGDDCIAIKSGRNADGRRVNIPSQDIVIQDCTFANGRGGFIENTNVWRASVTAIGGPLLLIDYNYGEGNAGSFPPAVNGITLSGWTVTSATQGWNIAGYATDPVGTVTLRDVTIASPLAKANVAVNITSLVLDDVVIDGVAQ
jgi:hypothetical protein